MKKFKAFTLAETMIVIVVLGIIATLTIPALVNKNKESVAKTKVRKAMAAYESALNKMIIENDLKSDTALNEWAGAVQNCGNPSNYFKKVQDVNGCIFKTSDGIWWDISNIERPLIGFKQDDLTTDKANNANDYSAFVLVGRFGTDGSLRVDDLAYETGDGHADQDSDKQVKKLYSFLGLYKDSNAGGGETISCDADDIFCDVKTYINEKRAPFESLDYETICNSNPDCTCNYYSQYDEYIIECDKVSIVIEGNFGGISDRRYSLEIQDEQGRRALLEEDCSVINKEDCYREMAYHADNGFHIYKGGNGCENGNIDGNCEYSNINVSHENPYYNLSDCSQDGTNCTSCYGTCPQPDENGYYNYKNY